MAYGPSVNIFEYTEQEFAPAFKYERASAPL